LESTSSANYLLLPDKSVGSDDLDGTLMVHGTQVLDVFSKRNRKLGILNKMVNSNKEGYYIQQLHENIPTWTIVVM
jgi:hypothetical protein